MRAFGAVAILLALSIVSAGCKESRREAKETPPAGDSSLSSRLAAANAIGNNAKKDDALAKLAADAAQAGDALVVKEALKGMGSMTLRDTTAAEAARRLAAAGKGEDAVEVAKSIGRMDLRDETLQAIARNE